VRRKLEEFGTNTFAEKKKTNLALELLKKFNSPLLIILVTVAIVSFFLGERVNAIIILSMTLISGIMDFINTFKSERALEALASRVETLTRVIRDGKETEISVKNIVPGDIVLLSAGKLVPADVTILEATDFFVNQSSLTGESYPAEKRANGNDLSKLSLFEQENRAFLGTSVVTGFATAEVFATGKNTEFGKIAGSLEKATGETDFEHGIRTFSLFVMKLNFLLVGFVLLANTLLGRGAIESITFAVAIAIGLTPELLPVMLSVSLSRGSVKMSKKNVIVKNLSSIQNFGSMDILCTDKTGTLTEDRITLVKHIDGSGEQSEEVFRYSYLNSIFHSGVKNPLDQAIRDHSGEEHGSINPSLYEKIEEVPFDFVRRRDSMVIRQDGKKILVTKGAPEKVLGVSTFSRTKDIIAPIDAPSREKLGHMYEDLSREGFRVLGIATKELDREDYAYDKEDETGMTFLGFVAFIDPPKKDVARVVNELAASGVTIKILTGDSDLLTEKICHDIGIEVQGTVLGTAIHELSDTALAQLAERTTIFARLTPEDKERIIFALREHGRHVVGYMGDGINDVTALRAADVGISVNNAVDVAKEAADIILLEKNLDVLHEGITEGRKTFQNTLKYVMMWLSSNFGNMFSMMGASVLLPFLPMSPQQILLNNFLYDGAQVGLPTDNVDPEDVRKPPRWDIAFIKRFMFIFGPISSLFDFATFGLLYFAFDLTERQFQTGWFIESIATQILVIFLIRTKKLSFFGSRPSLLLLASTIPVVLVAWVIPFSPLGGPFGFEILPLPIFLSIIAITLIYLALVEIAKKYFYRTLSHGTA
jgi:Mg2+-importing ATPase